MAPRLIRSPTTRRAPPRNYSSNCNLRNLRKLRIFYLFSRREHHRPLICGSQFQAEPIVGQGARCRERLASLGVTDIVAKMREEGALRL